MVVFAYLREGVVYRDYESWENGDRIGTFYVAHRTGRPVIETNIIGGKKYTGLWIWDGSKEDQKNYGIVPLISVDE